MKHLLFLLVLMAVLMIILAACAGEPVIEIFDINGLQEISDHPGASFRLMNDIDMQGVDWTPVLLDGEFDGNGHGIYNMTVTQVGRDTRITVDGNRKEYETTFAGLFSVVEKGSSVHDLKIMGAHVTIEGKTHCFASIMAGYAMHCRIDNVTVEGRVRLDNEAVMSGVAGIVGFGSGIILSGDVRRRHDDGEGLFLLIPDAPEEAALFPEVIDLRLHGMRIVHFRQFFHGSNHS